MVRPEGKIPLMNIIEFTQGFTGNPGIELYEFLGCVLLVVALTIGWIAWNQTG